MEAEAIKPVSGDYMILDPTKASVHDLFRIVYSSQLEKREFFHVPKGKGSVILKGFACRWIIFLSVFQQKILQLLKPLMALIGSAVEVLLNYPPANGGYLGLLINILTGRVVRPNGESTSFRSILGHLDTRVDLDKRIAKDDERYGAALTVMASKLAYENEAFSRSVVTGHWKMEFLGTFNFWNAFQRQSTTQAMMFRDKSANLIVVAFRGTSPFDADDWATDVDLSLYHIEGVGRLHYGFMKALGLQKSNTWPKEIHQGPNSNQYAYYSIRERLRKLLREDEGAKFLVTGHSLGGALAILFPSILVHHEEKWLLERLEGVYTYGQPRVGDAKYGDFMTQKFKEYNVKYYRYVYHNDLVPRVPFDNKAFVFKHFGLCYYFNSCYRGKILLEEPNKNFFSLFWTWPKLLSSAFELVRSFFIPLRGLQYRENLLMILCRVVGLATPGLVNHGPQDYVNLTRLGSLPRSSVGRKEE